MWGTSIAQWQALTGETDAANYGRFDARFARLSNWNGIIRAAEAARPGFERYSRSNRALFEIVQRGSGNHVISDSSKSPARALALSLVKGIDVFVVHLVRDVRGVVLSNRKQHARRQARGAGSDFAAVPRTIVNWVIVNAASSRLRARMPAGQSALVRYEDLIADPARVLETLGKHAGIDLAGALAQRLRERTFLNENHLFNGNHIRLNAKITLSLDTEWKTALPAFDQRLSMTLAGRVMKSLGYS